MFYRACHFIYRFINVLHSSIYQQLSNVFQYNSVAHLNSLIDSIKHVNIYLIEYTSAYKISARTFYCFLTGVIHFPNACASRTTIWRTIPFRDNVFSLATNHFLFLDIICLHIKYTCTFVNLCINVLIPRKPTIKIKSTYYFD